MKVYIVTSGFYSDYRIENVFTDKSKADEYAEWLEDVNEVEEYETNDELQVDKYYVVRIKLRFFDDGKENLNTSFYKTCKNIKYNNCAQLIDNHRYGYHYMDLYIRHTVPEVNWNEEFYINKYTKVAYDILAKIKQMIMEGISNEQINEMLSSK